MKPGEKLWIPLFLAAGIAGTPLSALAQAPNTKPPAPFLANSPYSVTFPAHRARFVRIMVHRSSSAQPCIDELEVYGPDSKLNLALASRGAKAAASSCLPGYAIHQIAHLNDGRYGNSHSWIAAGKTNEWAQVELARPAVVSKVVLSRDRAGEFSDRVPVVFEVRLSLDGRTWRTARRVETSASSPRKRRAGYVPPVELPQQPTWDQLLRYAFECERHTWGRMSANDHLSPLRADRPALPGGEGYWRGIARMDPLSRTLVQTEQMIERLRGKGLDVAKEQIQLAELRKRQASLAGAKDRDPIPADSLYHDARLAKRRLMFRDPDLAPLERILFVKRHPYHSSHNYSDVLDSEFRGGGGVCVLRVPRRGSRLAPSEAKLTTLFDAGEGIARDPVARFDAGRVFFAYRPDKSPVKDWNPYWRLMTTNADGGGTRQLTDGPFHDYYPCPLPDGGLAFISTRCKARFLCWRPQAFALFRMDADGSNIRPLSFANLSEWSPCVMRDGRILWTRSEYLDKGADFGHTLWAIRPDGTHAKLVFGNNTPNCYLNGHEVPGTREICCTLISHGGDHNGPIGLIDLARGPFDPEAITNITPDIKPHYNMSWPRYECFRDPVPVAREYFLVSHAPADRFGLYVIDRYGNRELLYLDPTIGSMSPTPLRPGSRPPILNHPAHRKDRPHEGRFVLADVNRGIEPTVPRGTVKYIRICQEVRADLTRLSDGQYRSDHQPFQDWYATPIHKIKGPHGWPSYVAKASLGIVPVEADGSAYFTAPADKVLYFQAMDGHFNELQRMRSVVQLQADETRSCIGCHESRTQAPPSRRLLALRHAPSNPEAPPWGAGPFAYEKAVQPVWDAKCVRCHNAAHKRGINLTGNLDKNTIPASYRTLIAGGWVHYFDCQYKQRHHKAEPVSFGTNKSKLWRVLGAGHNDVVLTESEMRAVKCWIDLNCPLWPDYQFRPDRRSPTASRNAERTVHEGTK